MCIGRTPSTGDLKKTSQSKFGPCLFSQPGTGREPKVALSSTLTSKVRSKSSTGAGSPTKLLPAWR